MICISHPTRLSFVYMENAFKKFDMGMIIYHDGGGFIVNVQDMIKEKILIF